MHTPHNSGYDEVDKASRRDEAEMETGADGAEDAETHEVHTQDIPQSPASSVFLDDATHPPSSDLEGYGSHPPELTLKRKRRSDPDMERGQRCGMQKCKRVGGGVEIGTGDEESCGERGESRSAVASRKLKESLKSGEFVADERKRTAFEEKCKKMGDGAKFRYGEKWEVLHQKCGKWSTMTEPYNATRFKAHIKTCKAKGTKGHNGCIDDFFRPRGDSAGAGGLVKGMQRPAIIVRRQVVVGSHSVKSDPETPPVVADSLPCLGLREDHDNRIPKYISRALTEGAGSRSESHITIKLFGDGTKYSELGDKGKQLVQAAQVHSRAWTINRELQAIYSTSCRKVIHATAAESACPECMNVLRLESFKKALSVEPAPLASKKYIPHRWRTAATDLAINLADINGLPGLLEAVSPLTSAPPPLVVG